VAWREEVRRRGTRGEVHFQINSDLKYLEELNKLLASLFLHTGLPADEVYRLGNAVRELGVNAIEWGHRKQVERLVTLTYRIDAEKIEIIIRDEGEGFDHSNVPHAAKDHDPVGHMSIREELGLRVGGFGILLSRGLVDELTYNDVGNEVRLVKRLTASSNETPRRH
jgi:anti-sigma regulatory factor (Ser/Thr protein kinase)